MAEAGMNVTKFETKSHNSPDEVRAPNKTRVEVVRLPGFTMGRLNFEPGWKWSECIKPVVGTDSCQVAHVGYAVSGRLTVRLNDGTQKTFEPGMSYTNAQFRVCSRLALPWSSKCISHRIRRFGRHALPTSCSFRHQCIGEYARYWRAYPVTSSNSIHLCSTTLR